MNFKYIDFIVSLVLDVFLFDDHVLTIASAPGAWEEEERESSGSIWEEEAVDKTEA